MNRDLVLEAIERHRNKSPVQQFLSSPLRTIRERHYLLYSISGLIALACAAIAFYLHMEASNILILAFLIFIMPPSFFDLYEAHNIDKMESEFPALVRDISLSVKSGMTIEQAMRMAAAGQYGALSKAIKQMDHMISWGASFDEALLHFASKYPTPLIRRTVFTLIEASSMGGRLGEILEGVAMDVEETKSLEKRRSSETKPYLMVGYISYFVFMAVILIMTFVFLPMMKEAAGASSGGSLPSGMGRFAVSDTDMATYNRLFFHALVIQGFFTGIVTGKMGEGKAIGGLKHSVIFIIVAVLAYALMTRGGIGIK
jgi:archaeal flagellar protein FlaJ